MKITVEWLKKHDACGPGIREFEDWLIELDTDAVEVTAENLLLADLVGLDVEWFIATFRMDEQVILATGNPNWAVDYADTYGASPALRALALRTPRGAYRWACCGDRGPADDTRAKACEDPKYAMWYAEDVDRPAATTTTQT